MGKILEYFAADPMRLLYFLGGSGGISFWVKIWRDRIRIRVNKIELQFDETGQKIKFIFEVVNCGNLTTSLNPTVAVDGYCQERPSAAKIRHKGNLTISVTSRSLPPHNPKLFEAVGNIEHHYISWIFKSYSISVSQGRGVRVYVRSNPPQSISGVRYYYELAKYLLFNKLP